MLKMGRQTGGWTRTCAVLVTFSFLTAEFAAAQGMGGLLPQNSEQVIRPQAPPQIIVPPSSGIASEQTIVTNPRALQPLTPVQVPCPPPFGRQPMVFQVGSGQQGVPQTVGEQQQQQQQQQQFPSPSGPAPQFLTPGGPGQYIPPGSGQQYVTPGGPGQFAPQAPGPGQQYLSPGGPGQFLPFMGQQFVPPPGQGQQGVPQAGLGQQGMLQPGPGQQLNFQGGQWQQFGFQGGQWQQGVPTGEELSIEEGFSRFFVLQGITSRLRQFGYNFFDFPVTSFAPVMDVPVGPDYVIGPDDTLSIHIWNVPDSQFNRNYIIPVERDGNIFLRQVGMIPVAGQTFSEATRLIRTRMGQVLKRFELSVAMARLRTIKVYVVGEVVRPGAYEISSLAAASNAIYAACGPAKSGSLRKIQIVRDGKTVSELDFYRFLIKGDRTQDARLQSGDTILIPPMGQVAAIGGPVRRPAIYELNGEATLTDLIDLAGGLAPTADRKRCQIFRVDAGKDRVIRDVDLGKALAQRTKRVNGVNGGNGADPMIQDGDFVRIASVTTEIENAVTLAGAVKNPGPYEYKPGMRIGDLLSPDRLLVDAYQDRAELIRTEPVTYTTTVLTFSPKGVFEGSAEDNHELRRLDKVVVLTQFRPPGSVRVGGEVRRPGTYTIEIGERLSSVLKRAGGFTERAFPQGLMLLRESVRTAQQVELQRFVTVQKQQLLSHAASYSAGGDSGTSQTALNLQLQQLDALGALTQPGRIVVKMDSLEKFEGTADDIMLENGDLIGIPQPPQTVAIMGAVRTPSTVVYREGWRLEDYLKQAGGPTEEASKKEIYVVRANGSTDSTFVNVKQMAPGDTVVVPPKMEPKYRALPLWQSVASIIGSAALTAGSLAIIGR